MANYVHCTTYSVRGIQQIAWLQWISTILAQIKQFEKWCSEPQTCTSILYTSTVYEWRLSVYFRRAFHLLVAYNIVYKYIYNRKCTSEQLTTPRNGHEWNGEPLDWPHEFTAACSISFSRLSCGTHTSKCTSLMVIFHRDWSITTMHNAQHFHSIPDKMNCLALT